MAHTIIARAYLEHALQSHAVHRARVGMESGVVAYVVMARAYHEHVLHMASYVVMAHIGMAYIVMAYLVMAYIVIP